MNSGDWATMQADLTAIRDDNPVNIIIRREGSTLATQTVRVARAGRSGSRPMRSESGTEGTTGVVVLGTPSLDIQIDDRFTIAGILYRVDYVNPNRRSRTEAEATAVQ